MEQASPTLEPADTSKDDMAFWLYSSGTTGFPKGAIHLHHDMIVAADRYARETHRPGRVGRVVLGGQAVLRLRAGQRPVFSAADRRHHGPVARPAHARSRSSRPSTAISRRSSTACRPATRPCCTRRRRPAARAWAACGCASRPARPCPGTCSCSWRERFGVEILDGIGSTEILHIFISNRPGQARPGSTGRDRARLRGPDRRRRRPRSARRRGRHAADQGRQHRRRLLEQARGHQADLLRRVDQHLRQVHARPGRLLLVLGPGQRHAQGQRPGRLADRGRGGAAGASGRAGKRRDRGRQRRGAAQARGLRRAQGRPPALAGTGPRAAGVRQAATPPRTSIPRAVVFVDQLPKTATGKIKRFELPRTAGGRQDGSCCGSGNQLAAAPSPRRSPSRKPPAARGCRDGSCPACRASSRAIGSEAEAMLP